MKAIIAVNNIGMIGLDDKMLWHCKDDLIHFKNLTYNSRLLVGFITQQGLPIHVRSFSLRFFHQAKDKPPTVQATSFEYLEEACFSFASNHLTQMAVFW